MDNDTLDKVFNLVFGRYAKLYLLPDSLGGGCWPKFTVIAEGKAGIWWETGHELWAGPPKVAAEGLLTQLRVNVLGEDAAGLPISKLKPTLFCQSSGVVKELLVAASGAEPAALRVKRYIARGVIKLLEQYGGLAIAEDCDVECKILDVSSLEELLVKADLV